VYAATQGSVAAQCLSDAEAIYAVADTSPKILLTTAPHDYYPETEWRDDMELGAAELYYAAKQAAKNGVSTQQSATYYLNQAEYWANRYIKQDDASILNLYDVGGLAHYELFRAMKGLTPGRRGMAREKRAAHTQTVTVDDLLNNLKGMLDQSVAFAKKGVFAFADKYDNGDDLVPHAFGFALLASMWREMSTLNNAHDSNTFVEWELKQRDWLFGANAWGVSFVVGAGQSFPHCMQHQVANLVGSLDGQPPLLYGAVVDGPSQTDNFDGIGVPSGARKCPPNGGNPYSQFTGQGVAYMDNVKAWPSVEPADDYSVTGILWYARKISGL